MLKIDYSRSINVLQAINSTIKTQPKNTVSFFLKIMTVKNNAINLSRPQATSPKINTQAGLKAKRPAPPPPVQLHLAEKLNMALKDFERDPEVATAKWLSASNSAGAQKKSSVSPPRPVQPHFADKLKMAVRDFEQDPDMATAKWLSASDSAGAQEKSSAAAQPVQPHLIKKLKMAVRDFEQDPDMATAKWFADSNSADTPENQTGRAASGLSEHATLNKYSSERSLIRQSGH